MVGKLRQRADRLHFHPRNQLITAFNAKGKFEVILQQCLGMSYLSPVYISRSPCTYMILRQQTVVKSSFIFSYPVNVNMHMTDSN
ncbi:hypothetical protein Y1Q_0010289 [Alligator mississippiensis]|uniref:Uncharacterized protein n=1 Tax=Alligator mississippiensis TaxID=8496 RepID=A0A151NME4_ALLMI|nr:hypothetical protein Y1Q_0010289 [Alligator mississippiensis]